jgi:hypothetical protein
MPQTENFHIDYSSCPYKQHVRTNGWLDACKRQYETVEKARNRRRRKRQLQYFTFCAVEAIDVYLLRKEKVIFADANGRLNNVYFCEKDPDDYAAILDQFRSETGGFQGELTDIILVDGVENDTAPIELDDEAPPKTREERRLDDLRDKHRRLRSIFPLDIINFDICGHVFPPNPARVKNFERMLERIFEWQKRVQEGEPELDNFLLMPTLHVESSSNS